jgi:hypothetical protein
MNQSLASCAQIFRHRHLELAKNWWQASRRVALIVSVLSLSSS